MAGYFDKETAFDAERSRVLVMNLEALNTGLLVTEVYGLRHFDEGSERHDEAAVDDSVAPHLQGVFLRDNVLWGVFNMHSLAGSDRFMHVAA